MAVFRKERLDLGQGTLGIGPIAPENRRDPESVAPVFQPARHADRKVGVTGRGGRPGAPGGGQKVRGGSARTNSRRSPPRPAKNDSPEDLSSGGSNRRNPGCGSSARPPMSALPRDP